MAAAADMKPAMGQIHFAGARHTGMLWQACRGGPSGVRCPVHQQGTSRGPAADTPVAVSHAAPGRWQTRWMVEEAAELRAVLTALSMRW